MPSHVARSLLLRRGDEVHEQQKSILLKSTVIDLTTPRTLNEQPRVTQLGAIYPTSLSDPVLKTIKPTFLRLFGPKTL